MSFQCVHGLPFFDNCHPVSISVLIANVRGCINRRPVLNAAVFLQNFGHNSAEFGQEIVSVTRCAGNCGNNYDHERRFCLVGRRSKCKGGRLSVRGQRRHRVEESRDLRYCHAPGATAPSGMHPVRPQRFSASPVWQRPLPHRLCERWYRHDGIS